VTVCLCGTYTNKYPEIGSTTKAFQLTVVFINRDNSGNK